MRRLFTLLLILALIFIINGCKQKQTNTPNSQSQPQNQETINNDKQDDLSKIETSITIPTDKKEYTKALLPLADEIELLHKSVMSDGKASLPLQQGINNIQKKVDAYKVPMSSDVYLLWFDLSQSIGYTKSLWASYADKQQGISSADQNIQYFIKEVDKDLKNFHGQAKVIINGGTFIRKE